MEPSKANESSELNILAADRPPGLELTPPPAAPWQRPDRMEIQPAALDERSEETLLLVREDSSEAATQDDASGGSTASGGGGGSGHPDAQLGRLRRRRHQGLVDTVDGDRVPAEAAQALCRKNESLMPSDLPCSSTIHRTKVGGLLPCWATARPRQHTNLRVIQAACDNVWRSLHAQLCSPSENASAL